LQPKKNHDQSKKKGHHLPPPLVNRKEALTEWSSLRDHGPLDRKHPSDAPRRPTLWPSAGVRSGPSFSHPVPSLWLETPPREVTGLGTRPHARPTLIPNTPSEWEVAPPPHKTSGSRSGGGGGGGDGPVAAEGGELAVVRGVGADGGPLPGAADPLEAAEERRRRLGLLAPPPGSGAGGGEGIGPLGPRFSEPP